jgi:hypothetical protein
VNVFSVLSHPYPVCWILLAIESATWSPEDDLGFLKVIATVACLYCAIKHIPIPNPDNSESRNKSDATHV